MGQEKLFEILKNNGLEDSKVTFDVRILATTTKDIGKMVDNGEFHRELYEYLSTAFVFIEPLRRRIEDIELLMDYFLKIECKNQGLLLKNFSQKAIEKFSEYDWPGNVKELQKSVQRAVLYNPKAHILTEVTIENDATPLVDLAQKQRMFGAIPHVSDFKIPLKDRVALVERLRSKDF